MEALFITNTPQLPNVVTILRNTH